MDTPAYLLLGIRQITQLFPTSRSVITLGHTLKEPLIRPSSELVDGLEPHDYEPSGVQHGVAPDGELGAVGRVYPGWCSRVGGGRVVPGIAPSHPPVSLRPV